MTYEMKLIRGKSLIASNNREKPNEVMTEGEITFSSFIFLVEFTPSFQKRIQCVYQDHAESTLNITLFFFSLLF